MNATCSADSQCPEVWLACNKGTCGCDWQYGFVGDQCERLSWESAWAIGVRSLCLLEGLCLCVLAFFVLKRVLPHRPRGYGLSIGILCCLAAVSFVVMSANGLIYVRDAHAR